MGKTTRLTTSEFIERAKKIHGEKYDYSKVDYVNFETKVCIICPEHGEFWQTPHNHINGNNCPMCKSNGIIGKNNTLEFIRRAKKIHGNKYDYSKSEYINSKTKIKILCPVHGEFEQVASYHLTGRGCPICARENVWKKRGRISTDEFIEKAKKIHGDKYDYSETIYNNVRKKIKIICHKKYKNGVEHGAFLQTPASHLNGKGCPHCRNSRLETYIHKFLVLNKITFEKEKTFEWLKNKGHLYLDFYLPDYNIAIECQGIQHFIPLNTKIKEYDGEIKFKYIIENDKLKEELCTKNGIKLLYYTDGCIYKEYKKNNMFYTLDDLKKEIYGES